jgi:uroporphyrinogen decarboxylase
LKKDKYPHRERLELIFAGEKPDRFAASFWRHFFDMEHHAEGTAEAMIGWQKKFDWDFMKINPRADYHTQDWGLKLTYSHHEHRKHLKSNFPVQTVDDWAKIEPLSPTAPVLAEHLKVVSTIRKSFSRELPLLMTVFTPLSVAGRLVNDDDKTVKHLRSHPDKVEAALEAITQTFVTYTQELRNAGADGLFYATCHWATENRLTWEEYQRFGLPYDLRVIAATDSDAINCLHVCEGSNYLQQLVKNDYKSQMVNWDTSDPTNLPLDRAEEQIPNLTLVGGVDHTGWLIRSEAAEMNHFIDELKTKHRSTRIIVGPGCAIDPATPLSNLQAIRENL